MSSGGETPIGCIVHSKTLQSYAQAKGHFLTCHCTQGQMDCVCHRGRELVLGGSQGFSPCL